jgi:hypothetical protein
MTIPNPRPQRRNKSTEGSQTPHSLEGVRTPRFGRRFSSPLRFLSWQPLVSSECYKEWLLIDKTVKTTEEKESKWVLGYQEFGLTLDWLRESWRV